MAANDWLRIGLGVAGGAVAYVAAKRLGFIGARRRVHWCKSEDEALLELRLDRQGQRQRPIPSSPILVSESQVASHRGYR